MEDKQKQDVMPTEGDQAYRCKLTPESCRAWIEEASPEKRAGIPISSETLTVRKLYPQGNPQPPNHGIIVIPQTNRRSTKGFQVYWKMFKMVYAYLVTRNGKELTSEEKQLVSIGHVSTKEMLEEQYYQQATHVEGKGSVNEIMNLISRGWWKELETFEKELFLQDNQDAILVLLKTCADMKQDAQHNRR